MRGEGKNIIQTRLELNSVRDWGWNKKQETWAKLKSLGTNKRTNEKKHEIIASEMIDGEAIEIYGGNNLAD